MATKTVQQNTKAKTAVAHARYLRISPRKMRLVTNLVKGMWALDAVSELRFTNKKAAKYVLDVVNSAIANAENNFKLKKENLYIKTITCDAGPRLKRYMPRAQGRATEIRKPTSHVHVILEQRSSAKKRKFTFKDKSKPELAVKEDAGLPESKADKVQPEKAKVQRSQTAKTGEQVKANKVTQKRRLFNRKSGV